MCQPYYPSIVYMWVSFYATLIQQIVCGGFVAIPPSCVTQNYGSSWYCSQPTILVPIPPKPTTMLPPCYSTTHSTTDLSSQHGHHGWFFGSILSILEPKYPWKIAVWKGCDQEWQLCGHIGTIQRRRRRRRQLTMFGLHVSIQCYHDAMVLWSNVTRYSVPPTTLENPDCVAITMRTSSHIPYQQTATTSTTHKTDPSTSECAIM